MLGLADIRTSSKILVNTRIFSQWQYHNYKSDINRIVKLEPRIEILNQPNLNIFNDGDDNINTNTNIAITSTTIGKYTHIPPLLQHATTITKTSNYNNPKQTTTKTAIHNKQQQKQQPITTIIAVTNNKELKVTYPKPLADLNTLGHIVHWWLGFLCFCRW